MFKSNTSRRTALLTTAGLFGAFNLVSLFFYFYLIDLVDRAEGFDMEAYEMILRLEGFVEIWDFIEIGVWLALLVTLIMYVYRVQKNLASMEAQISYSPGWAIGAWFVPFLNLWRPYQIIREGFHTTCSIVLALRDEPDHERAYQKSTRWMTAACVTLAFTIVSSRIVDRAVFLIFLHTVLSVATGFCMFQYVRSFARWERGLEVLQLDGTIDEILAKKGSEKVPEPEFTGENPDWYNPDKEDIHAEVDPFSGAPNPALLEEKEEQELTGKY